MIVYPSKHIDEIIPSEVVIQILQHLEPRSRCRAARVSRRWNVIAYSDPGLWQRLDLSKRISWAESDETRNSLTRWATSTGNPVDERLRFLLANAAPRTPSTLTRFRRLQRLSLNFCPSVDLTVFEEPQLVGLLGECLTHLSLNGCGDGVDSFTLYHLRGLKGLCSLDVAHCEQIDDRGMEVIAHFMQQLSQLNLSYLFKLTDDGVRKLMRMPNLSSLDLTGCYRIKTYPWATSLAASTDSKRNPTLPLKELYLGEDSRLQTSRGFWLLWFSFSFNISTFVQCCPLLETLRLNMVLFDSVINDAGGGGGVNGVDNLAVAIVNAEAVAQPNVPQVSPQLRNALTLLVSHCKNLSHLSLIVDKSMVQSLCTKAVSARLSKLRALELTFHIGVTAEHLRQCVEFENGEALSRLTVLKFHSKHASVFDDRLLKAVSGCAKGLEFIEINAEEISCWGGLRVWEITGSRRSRLDNGPNDMLLSDGVKRRHFGQHTARSSISEGGLVCIADGLGKTLQSLFLHRATLTNSTLRRLGSGLSQLREMSMTDLTQIDRGNKLSILARPRKKSRFATHKSSLGAMKLETSTSLSAMRFRLRKLELSSVSGFTDLDIANFLSGFPLLQWVDLSFSFTYPRTLKVITDHCQYLSYLRLCALPNCKVQTPLSRQRRVSTTSPTRNSKKTVCSPYIPNSRNSLVPEYLIPSHPECRSFVRFAERGGRRLKVLDLTGELGINNFTLSALGSLPCLHTMFLDSIPRLSGDAVVKLVQRKASGNLEQDINSATANEFFGRSGLKRLYIRHCVGLQFTKIQRQKLIEGFKLELVVDGSRPMGSSVIEGEGMGEAEDDLSEIGDGPATGTNEPLIGEAEHENTEETEPLLS